jgi:hypothetical protein
MTRRFTPLWILRIVRDRQARKVLSPEQIKEADIKRRGHIAGQKVLALHIANASGMEARL